MGLLHTEISRGTLYPSGDPPPKLERFFIDILQNDQYSHDSIRPKFMKLSISMKVTIVISTAFKSANGHCGVGSELCFSR